MPAPLTAGIRRVLFNRGVVEDAGPVAPITQDDPNTHGWWRADSYITPNAYIGDRMNVTVNKASDAAPNFNLKVQATPEFNYTPNITDNDCNYLVSSEDLTYIDWKVSGATKDTATKATFLAQNGVIFQSCFWTEPGKTYTFKFKARAVSGNTNLHVFHSGSATGTSTPITVTGTLAEYSVSFLGVPVSGGVLVGIRDQNAGGWGQIELTETQMYRSDHSGIYHVTGVNPYSGKRDGIPVWASHGTGSSTRSYYINPAARSNAAPFTVYMSVYFRQLVSNAYIICANSPTLLGAILEHNLTGSPSTRIGQYHGAAPFTWRYGTTAVPIGQWHIVTAVWNGASSEIRVNKNAADVVSQPVGGPACDQWQVGGDSFASFWCDADFHEIISRYVVDDTATQDTFIDYMAARVGLSV